jgi:hypothetical protein
LTATTVGELPCVMTTVRPLLPFCFGMREICTHGQVQIYAVRRSQGQSVWPTGSGVRKGYKRHTPSTGASAKPMHEGVTHITYRLHTHNI